MLQWTVLGVLLVALAWLAWRYYRLAQEMQTRAQQLHHAWRSEELEQEAYGKASAIYQAWRQEAEKDIRKDAIQKSESVILGKVTEHLIPYFPDFGYNPRDARFLGTPVDFIVFDGLSEGEVKRIVFIEVKTGRNASLSTRERQVRRCIRQKRITYDMLHHEGED